MADEVYHPAVRGIVDNRMELANREQNLREQDSAQNHALAEHQAVLHSAATYLGLAQNLAKMQQEAQQNIQAGDFLTKAKDISVNDPEYEAKVAQLHADLPHAAGHPAVQDYLQFNEPARNQFMAAQKTKDLLAQEGKLPGETATRSAYAAGLLKDSDFEWNGDKVPPIYKSDGQGGYTVNHEHAAWIAAQRAGNQEGVKGEALKHAQNLQIINAGIKFIHDDTLNDPENADFKVLYNAALKEEAGKAKPDAAPGAAKPSIVTQGGHTYNLQPDGSYK